MKLQWRIISYLWLVVLMAPDSRADELVLRVPVIEDAADNHHFFYDVLQQALVQQGHKVVINEVTVPHNRARLLLERGEITLLWMLGNQRRDDRFLPVHVGLTNGLVGQRVLLINREDQPLYDGVSSLDDFKKLQRVAGLGGGWFDVAVWRSNDLLYKEHSGNWQTIYRMLLAKRVYEYFPRGLHEAVDDVNRYPGLTIEQRLLLVYDRDFKFYLSPEGPFAHPEYQTLIQQALEAAQQSGLIKRLVTAYWGEQLEVLNYEQRIRLHLQTPQ